MKTAEKGAKISLQTFSLKKKNITTSALHAQESFFALLLIGGEKET